MRLLCVTDLHGRLDIFEKILAVEPRPDVLILGGDLTHFGTPQDAEPIVERAEAAAPVVLAVAGNCDSADIDQWLIDRGVSVHGRGRLVDSIGFFGVSAMPRWIAKMYAFTEEQIDGFLAAGHAQIATATRKVLVSHTPPHDCRLDRTLLGFKAGSTMVRKWVQEIAPSAVVCGHIHESKGQIQLGGSLIVNCGPAKSGHYAVASLGERPTVELKQVAT